MNILVTGGASGLGEAITSRLSSDETNKIYFTYNRSKDKAGQLEQRFANSKAIPCDFTDAASVDRLLNEMEKYDLDCLINNALTGLTMTHFHKTDPEAFLKGFQENVLPVIKITQKAILGFRKKKAGKIITILTSYLQGPPPTGLSEYVASKAYVESLSKSWGSENAKFNIISNCISPSFMQTHLTADTDERIIEEMAQSLPLKRLLTTDEVAETVESFVKESKYPSGANLFLNTVQSS